MIRTQGCDLVALVAGDSVSSMTTEEFLRRADAGCADPSGALASPVIPNGYDRVARWQIQNKTVTREQLAMVPVLMSHQASRHPAALNRRPYSLEEVLSSRPIAPATNLLETARRADGAACVIVASSRFMETNGIGRGRAPAILGGGEASGPLFPPRLIDEEMFSCEVAVERAYDHAALTVEDIDYFGLYDCFPICFVRSLEAVGLAPRGGGGQYVERAYRKLLAHGSLDPTDFPVNTHGGLLSFGAPWEAPALFSVLEAVDQLNGDAATRQVPNARRALVYGNGGIFSASAVALLSK